MNLRQIGKTFNNYGIPTLKYFSSDYILEADILIINLELIDKEVDRIFEFNNGVFQISQRDLDSFQKKLKQRTQEIEKYLAKGGNLFVFLPDSLYQNFNAKVDGGEDQNIEFNLLQTIGLEIKDFEIVEQHGTIITVNEELNFFFKQFRCSYSLYFAKYIGIPVAKIVRSDWPVSLLIPSNNGHIIILPELEETITGLVADAFIAFDKILRNGSNLDSNTEQAPIWVNDYTFGDEEKEIDHLNNLLDRQKHIQLEINKQLETLNYFIELKRLLFSSGKNLERIVEKVFEEFGYSLEPPVPNRDDLILKFNGDVGVVEIKVLKGSSAEKHAAQLMKWVNNYHMENEINPKGILIVNTYKDKPLEDRTEADFPDQMLPYAKQQKFCLVTTKTVLMVYLDFKSNLITIEQIHKLLFDTVGILEYQNVNKIEKAKVVIRQ